MKTTVGELAKKTDVPEVFARGTVNFLVRKGLAKNTGECRPNSNPKGRGRGAVIFEISDKIVDVLGIEV